MVSSRGNRTQLLCVKPTELGEHGTAWVIWLYQVSFWFVAAPGSVIPASTCSKASCFWLIFPLLVPAAACFQAGWWDLCCWFVKYFFFIYSSCTYLLLIAAKLCVPACLELSFHSCFPGRTGIRQLSLYQPQIHIFFVPCRCIGTLLLAPFLVSKQDARYAVYASSAWVPLCVLQLNKCVSRYRETCWGVFIWVYLVSYKLLLASAGRHVHTWVLHAFTSAGHIKISQGHLRSLLAPTNPSALPFA